MTLVDEAWYDSHLRFNIMNSIEKLVASRKDTVKMLTARIAEWDEKARTCPVGPAKKAIDNMRRNDMARLERVQEELVGLEALLVDPRQAELPGAGKAPKR